jgi:hypothetical protein
MVKNKSLIFGKNQVKPTEDESGSKAGAFFNRRKNRT